MYHVFYLIILLFNKQSNCESKDEKSTIEDLFTSSKLVEGKKFSITCQVNSGKVAYEWFLNGKKIVENENVIINDLDDKSLLNIKKMSLDYSGEYTCKIENNYGQQDSKSISVKLNGKRNNFFLQRMI